MNEQARTVEFEVSGEQLKDKAKELWQKGKERRVSVRNEKGETVFGLPLHLGALAALVKPKLAALGALIAIFGKGSIVVEKAEDEAPSEGV